MRDTTIQEIGEKFDEHIFTRAFKLSCELGNMQAENTLLKRELALLRKVAEAARSVVGFGPCHDANSYWSLKKLSNALDEYQTWKEGQK